MKRWCVTLCSAKWNPWLALYQSVNSFLIKEEQIRTTKVVGCFLNFLFHFSLVFRKQFAFWHKKLRLFEIQYPDTSILCLHISSPIDILIKDPVGENYQILTEVYVHLHLTTECYTCTVWNYVSVWVLLTAWITKESHRPGKMSNTYYKKENPLFEFSVIAL